MIKKVLNILAVLIIVCSVISPAVAANSKEVSVLEVIEVSKEKVTISEFTSTASGDSKVKSKDISLKTEKLDKSLKISSTTKIKSKSVDSHDILVPVADIQNFNGHSVRITHYDDSGIQDNEYIQEVVVQDGYMLIPDVEFSSIIVDGFTGQKSEVSYNVNVTDYEFEVTENGSLTITLGGVDDGINIDYVNDTTLPISNLKGWWKFDDGVGTQITDYSGNGYNATATSIEWVDGIYSLAGGFNGTNYSYIDTSDFQFNGSNFSVSGWIYLDNSVISASMVSCGRGVSSTQNYGWNVQYISGYLVFDTHYNLDRTYISHSMTKNEWHYITATLNNNTGIGSLYIDNSLVASGIMHTNISYAIDYDLTFARWSNTAGYYLDGYEDNFIITEDVLTQNNITVLYTGYSGTSAKLGENGEWQPVINGTVTFENVTAGETVYILSAYPTTADTLTKLYEYTQDYTLISESETADNVQVQINATAGANMSTSQLVYDVSSSNFTFNMSISSDNSNVTGTYHNGTVTLNTGYLNFGDSFNYTLKFDKLTYPFTYNVTWTSKTSTSAAFNYSSNNSNVEQDIYLSTCFLYQLEHIPGSSLSSL